MTRQEINNNLQVLLKLFQINNTTYTFKETINVIKYFFSLHNIYYELDFNTEKENTCVFTYWDSKEKIGTIELIYLNNSLDK